MGERISNAGTIVVLLALLTMSVAIFYSINIRTEDRFKGRDFAREIDKRDKLLMQLQQDIDRLKKHHE